MSTLATLRTALGDRLGDAGHTTWTSGEKDTVLNASIKSLYPSFFQRQVDTTEAGDGPIQTAPAGARNLYLVGLQRTGSTRVRPLRGWSEGDGEAFVPKTGISGQLLVWAWTSGWDSPSDETDILTFPREAEEVVLLRAEIALLSQLIADRVRTEKYHALQVRQGTTEEDIVLAIDAKQASLRDLLERVIPLPEVRA